MIESLIKIKTWKAILTMEKKQNYLTAAMTVLAPAIKPSLVLDGLPKFICKVQTYN